jgi:hypothetical protein
MIFIPRLRSVFPDVFQFRRPEHREGRVGPSGVKIARTSSSLTVVDLRNPCAVIDGSDIIEHDSFL